MAKGDLTIRIKANAAGAKKQIQGVNKSLRRMGGTAKRTGRQVGVLGGQMQSLSRLAVNFIAPALALRQTAKFIGSAVQGFASYDNALRQSISIAGETMEVYGKLDQHVKKLSADLGKAPQDVIANWKGLRSILDTNTGAMKANKDLTELLTTKMGDAGRVAVTFASAMKDFGVESDVLKVKIDQIISRSAFQDLDDWNDAMQEGLSTGKAFGRNIDEVLVVTKLFNDTLRNAPLAGNSYKMFMNKLGKKIVPQVQEALDDVGLKAKDVNTEFVDSVTVLKRLAAAQMNVAQTGVIFGERVGPRIKGMLEKINEGILDIDAAFALTIPDMDAYGTKLASMLNSAQTDINKTKTEWALFKLEFGEFVAPTLRSAMKELQIVIKETKSLIPGGEGEGEAGPIRRAFRYPREKLAPHAGRFFQRHFAGAVGRVSGVGRSEREAVERFQGTHPGAQVSGIGFRDVGKPTVIFYGDNVVQNANDMGLTEPGE